ncbi:amidohydrolase family protein [Bacteroidota bacterium]
MNLKQFFILCSAVFLTSSCNDMKTTLVLEDVTIIDGTGRSPLPSSCIIIEEGRIIHIGKTGGSDYPENAQLLNLSNKYVIPGLIEMHAHMYGKQYFEEVCQTLLSFGITTIRNPAGQAEDCVELRNLLASGKIRGPRMFTAGWLIDGPGSISGGIVVENEEEVRNVVRQQVNTGVDYIKLYTHLTPDLVKAAIDEGHSHGLEVIGHLGKTSWTFAANAGIDALLHSAMAGPIWELIPAENQDMFRNLANPTKDFDPNLFKAWGEAFDIDGPELKELIKILADNQVVVDPTLVMMEAMIWGNDTIYREMLESDFAPEDISQFWREEKLNPYTSWWSDEAFSDAQELFPVFLEIVKGFYDAGVLITAGSDQGNPWITPGVAFHRELELMVKAGIPELEVIKIATRNGAEALRILDETGTIEIGKQANLVVLNSDPIESIKNTRKIEIILKQGLLYYPE